MAQYPALCTGFDLGNAEAATGTVGRRYEAVDEAVALIPLALALPAAGVRADYENSAVLERCAKVAREVAKTQSIDAMKGDARLWVASSRGELFGGGVSARPLASMDGRKGDLQGTQ